MEKLQPETELEAFSFTDLSNYNQIKVNPSELNCLLANPQKLQTGVTMVLIEPLKTMTNLRKTWPTLLTGLGYKFFYYFLNKGKPTAVFIYQS